MTTHTAAEDQPVANRLPPALYRKLVIGAAATLVGGTLAVAASSGVIEQMGRAAGVRFAAASLDQPPPPVTVRPALGVMVVTSVGGMRPRLVLDIRNDGDTTIQRLYARTGSRCATRRNSVSWRRSTGAARCAPGSPNCNLTSCS